MQVIAVAMPVYFEFDRYFRWNGLMTVPDFRSEWNVWLSSTQSASSESCARMNSAKSG